MIKNLSKKSSTEKSLAEKKVKERKTTNNRLAFGNIRIAPKLLASFLIIAILSTLMGGYAVLSLQETSKATEGMYTGILQPAKDSFSSLSSFQELRMQARQLVLEENPAMMSALHAQLNGNKTSISSSLSLLESSIPKEHSDKLADIESKYNEYLALLDDLIEKAKAGNPQELLSEISKSSSLRSLESEIEKGLNDLIYVITSNASTIYASNKATASQVLSVTLIATCGLFIIAILIGLLISRSISKPVKSLTKEVKQLAAGNLDFEVSGKIQTNEIGQMREAVMSILKTIRSLSDDTGMLINAATEGKLSVRAGAEKHQGAYRAIVEGINSTLDAMISPITESSAVLEKLAQGHLNVSVDGDFAGDFSIIKNTLNDTIQTIKEYIDEITRVFADLADGILTVRIDSEFKGDFVAIKESVNRSILSFNQVLKEINSAAEEVASGAAQLSSSSQEISQGATEQTSALEQISASFSEISEKTIRNSQSANESSSLSSSAMDVAAGGTEKMALLQTAMEDINASSSSISKIIKVIDDIAFQTNILALNAAVEAARAGFHGKGFAVVAEEVRNLAAKSANAAKQTTELIESSKSKTVAGTQIADDTAIALQTFVDSIRKTVELSSKIAEASSEQATSIAQIDRGLDQLSDVVQNSSAAAQEAAASSEELAAQAERLKDMVRRFSLNQDDQISEYFAKNKPELLGDNQRIIGNRRNSIVRDDFGKY